ncbi:MAG: GDP-L-fucose synthase [bacterium]|nr:GDP-L-fucose synthase [bacterium]
MGTRLDIAKKRILVTGAEGFLARAVIPELRRHGAAEIATADRGTHDLREQEAVRRLLAETRPQVVIGLAGLVGGILVNSQRPAEFMYDNLMMGTILLHESWRAGVEKYAACMCGCAYPDGAPSPIREEMLWDGPPQRNSAPYGSAKRMLAVQAEAYRRQYGFDCIVLVPGNIYGPHENFNLNDAHVIPSLVRKFCEAADAGAPEVVVWGSGTPRRDFVYVGDAAEAIVAALERYSGPELINISSGTETAIGDLVALIARLCGYRGRIVWDREKPDGQAVKIFDVSRMERLLGHRCRTPIEDGLRRTIDWYRENRSRGGVRL